MRDTMQRNQLAAFANSFASMIPMLGILGVLFINLQRPRPPFAIPLLLIAVVAMACMPAIRLWNFPTRRSRIAIVLSAMPPLIALLFVAGGWIAGSWPKWLILALFIAFFALLISADLAARGFKWGAFVETLRLR